MRGKGGQILSLQCPAWGAEDQGGSLVNVGGTLEEKKGRENKGRQERGEERREG